MPTGYTADVRNGKITEFSDFALLCARAFGALVTMRDEPLSAPLPDKLEPSDYHSKAREKALDRLATLTSMSPAKAEREAEKAYDKQMKAHLEREAELVAERQRYEAMLAKVNEWTPPTKDHAGLKKFMKEQLQESIKFDCGGPYPAPERQTGAEWLAAEIKSATRDVEYHTEQNVEEMQRARGRTEWLHQLRKSLAA